MTNLEVAQIFHEIAEYLEMQGVPFKPRAYEKAAGVIHGLEESVGDIYASGGLKALEAVPGVGISIAEKIEELIKTGRLKYYEELKKKTPVDLSSLTKLEGLGPQKIKILYRELGIKNLADLEKAAKGGKIGKLAGFGEKSEKNILRSLEFAKKSAGRFVLGFIMPQLRVIEERLKKIKEVQRLVVAGSVRRRKETIGDADILVISKKPEIVMDYFTRMPEVAHVIARGLTKSAVKLKNGLNIDVRVVPEESYGAALNYFTGSKDHNIALRELAIKKGWKLSEYGLFSAKGGFTSDGKGKIIAGRTEEEIYEKLGLRYIEPEIRENSGEIELSAKNKLPQLIGYGDLRGDLQVQSNWTDGANSIYEMAVVAANIGLEYIAITDHTKRLAMTGGLDEKRIQVQWKEIDEVNQKLKTKNYKLKVLKGSECDILKDGSLDLPDEILSKLDVCGASVHSYFNLPREAQTKRIKKAMENKNVDIIFHPTGRVIQKREAYEVDIPEIVKTAKRTGTILEIDAYPDRLDLKDEYIRKCVEAGVKMSVDSDAHAVTHFPYLEYGIAQARRGWAAKNDIVNAWPMDKMLKFLKHG